MWQHATRHSVTRLQRTLLHPTAWLKPWTIGPDKTDKIDKTLWCFHTSVCLSDEDRQRNRNRGMKAPRVSEIFNLGLNFIKIKGM